ncbi:YlbF family regulator [Bacillus haynesii]|uniref:YlbF family regulator n=1 Tax=Bacillus TaxID=1386 RepID=UPI0012B87C01|nr:YlbF family regulator [Bacillus haynesii]NVB34074.1 YlbF family regulator [Bacillus licheniformis]MBU8683071.1 YlbF family regulator [Bacillus haynesii]MCY7777898.1 YlbF family regulator [Bacillus haynesii]MCY7836883.1 YlbF family regulator [Bacillus haynesii]MCY7845572.1 YlbF family regulator [Bacillus haynesii]
MTVNLHDSAYDLEQALRQSDEYSRLKNLYDEVNGDPSAKKMFDNFRDIQLNLQQKQMNGEDITQEEVEQAQKSVALVQQHEKISQLMEAEQRMSMLIAELNKIIMKPLEELYGNPES